MRRPPSGTRQATGGAPTYADSKRSGALAAPPARSPNETERERRSQVPPGASPLQRLPSRRGDEEWWRGRTIGSRESSLRSLYQNITNPPGRPSGLGSDAASSVRLQMAASHTNLDSRNNEPVSCSGSEVSSDCSGNASVSEPQGIPRDYAHVNDAQAERVFDVTREPMDWAPFSQYNIRKDKLLGQGAYGEVFLAEAPDGSEVVVKMIKTTPATMVKIQKEVMMLRRVQNGPHIVKLLGMVAEPGGDDSRGLVFEFLHNPNYKESFRRMSDLDARWYLFRLLEALDYTHSLGIIHRDVKGGNVLYDPKTKQVRLIDWGFAEFFRRNLPHSSWPGTRPYKAPELFLHYPFYDYSIDVWAFACVMASLVFRRTLFRSNDNFHQMELIGRLLGTASYTRYLRKYSKPPFLMDAKKYRFIGDRNTQRLGWSSFVSPKAPLATPDAIDMIDSILVWDHEKRPTARELLAHSYFDIVRNYKGRSARAPDAAAPRSARS